MARNRRNKPSTTTSTMEKNMANQETTTSTDNTSTVSDVSQDNTVSSISDAVSSVSSVAKNIINAVSTKEQNTTTEPEGNKVTEPGLEINNLKMNLERFLEETSMDKIHTPEFIARQQFSLFSTLKTIFNSKDQLDFNTKFNEVLKFFKDNVDKDNLSLKFIFRHPYAWPGSQNEYTFFRRLIYTIIETSDPKTRKKNITDINLETVATGLTEKQKNFLISFYEK